MNFFLTTVSITIVVWALISNLDFFTEKKSEIPSWNSNAVNIKKSNNIALMSVKLAILFFPFTLKIGVDSWTKFNDNRVFRNEQNLFISEMGKNEEFLAEKSEKEIQKYLKVDKQIAKALKKNSKKTKKIKLFALAVSSAFITFLTVLTWKRFKR